MCVCMCVCLYIYIYNMYIYIYIAYMYIYIYIYKLYIYGYFLSTSMWVQTNSNNVFKITAYIQRLMCRHNYYLYDDRKQNNSNFSLFEILTPPPPGTRGDVSISDPHACEKGPWVTLQSFTRIGPQITNKTHRQTHRQTGTLFYILDYW